MKNTLITVFTPTYNRAYIIGTLYESLLKQTDRNFEWLIVDDGSSDNTEEVIRSFVDEGKLKIHYFKQTNGGKHRAINFATGKAEGEVIYIVDSDDSLVPDSIERLRHHYAAIEKDEEFAGVCGMRCFPDGSRIGGEQKWDIWDTTWIKYWLTSNIKGDVALAFRTSVLRMYPFDDIPGERFCAESLVLNRIGQKYKMRFFNEKIYIADYLGDGLSSSSILNRMRCPNYALLIYSEMTRLDIPWLRRFKAYLNFWRFAPCSMRPFSEKVRQIGWSSVALWLVGMMLHLKDKRYNKIDESKIGH